MKINDSLLSRSEKIIFALQEIYLKAGYLPYRMSKFEEYDLYANNKSFLVSDRVITFTDTDGALMALKPDVTLSIIKNREDDPEATQKLFYRENVYRVPDGSDSFREIVQTGLECIGKVGNDETTEVISLAAESLKAVSENYVLELSDLDITEALIAAANVSKSGESELWSAINGKNVSGIYAAAEKYGADKTAAAALAGLTSLEGKIEDVLPKAEKLLSGTPAKGAFDRFSATLERLAKAGCAGNVTVGFSVAADVNYYGGTVFKGFVPGVPTAVLSGGRYDRLMRSMGKRSCAIGFAVYTDALERSDPGGEESAGDGYISVALPKGRIGDRVYSLFAEAGYRCGAIETQSRKLIFENGEKKIRFFLVKPSDVAIYVERGAADIGVAGSDILDEYEPDVYKLLDLRTGACRMTVAAKRGFCDDTAKVLRVATKYPNTAKKYYRSKGRSIDVIKLNGSIELAPILDLSDVIVDIVETGTTLKENDLSVVEEISGISAILIANKASMKFGSARINEIADGLKEVTERKK